MMFIMGKLPLNSKNLIRQQSYQKSQSLGDDDPENAKSETLLEMYLLCLLKIAVVYKSEKLSTTFPDTLLDSLLKVSISRNVPISNLAHEILQTLLDRQNNLAKLTVDGLTKTVEQNGIVIKKSTKADIMFFQKKKDELLWHIYQSASNRYNKPENVFVLYKTLVLLAIEINDTGILMELIRFVLSLQFINGEITLTRAKAAIHATVCACLNFIAELMGISKLRRYIGSCMKLRQNYKYLLPAIAFSEEDEIDFPLTELPSSVLISLEDVSKALEDGGFETKLLSSPYVPQPVAEVPDGLQDEKLHSLRSETGSLSSAEGMHFTIAEEVTFDALKEVLHRNASLDGNSDLYNATFNDIAAIADGRAREINVKIDDVLEVSDLIIEKNRVKETPSISSLPGEDNYKMNFLDKYVY